MEFMTVIHAEQDEDQRRSQLSCRDVNLAAQVARLERVGEARSQERASVRVKQGLCRMPGGAALLGRTVGAASPRIALLTDAEETVEQLVEEIAA
jgi:hypothetical protein